MAAVFANPAVADTDRYIVQFKDRGASGGYRALAASGASVQLSLDSVNAAAVLIPQRALNGLRNNPNLQGRVSVGFVIGRDGRVSNVGGVSTKELFQLFPKKPAKTMSYIAGVPKPQGCV